jgi:hypothetical protein
MLSFPKQSIGAILSLLFFSALPSPLLADDGWQVDFSGDIQARYAMLNNQLRISRADNDSLLSVRTNVRAIVKRGGLEFGAEVSDARAEFARNETELRTSIINTLEPVQMYGKYTTKGLFADGDTASLQLGRFTMDLANRRVLGRFRYRNSLFAFQGARADWRSANGNSLTAIAVMPGRIEPTNKLDIQSNKIKLDHFSTDYTFYGAYATNVSWVNSIQLEAYAFKLNEDDEPGTVETRNRDLLTIGGRVVKKSKAGQYDFEVEGAYQTGHARDSSSAADTTDLDVSAGFLHAEAGYRFEGKTTPRIALIYDFASGDKDPNDQKIGRYDSLFGPIRGDFGPTGLFLALARNNISAVGSRVDFNPAKGWNLMVHWQAAWLDETRDQFARTGVRDVTGQSGSFAGHQIEARSRYWLVPKKIRLELAVATFLNGEFFDQAPNASGRGNPIFGYAQIEVRF